MTARHCNMCRTRTSGILFAFPADPAATRIGGPVKVYRSSGWAERGFCADCGTMVFCRGSGGGPGGSPAAGLPRLSAGLFGDNAPDPGGAYFTDRAPASHALTGARARMTEAEVIAMFSSSGEGKSQ